MKTSFLLFSLLFLSSIVTAQPLKNSVEGDIFVDVTDEPKMIDTISKFLIYPQLAKENNLQGRVLFDVLIDTSGEIVKFTVTSATDSLFIEPASIALKRVRFRPALSYNKKPVKVWWTIPVVFKLD